MIRLLHVASFETSTVAPNGAASSALRLAINQSRLHEGPALTCSVLNVRNWSLLRPADSGVEVVASGLERAISAVRDADILHFNAVYPRRFLLVWAAAILTGTPYVISPRGNLSQVGRTRGRWKKLVAGWLAYRHFVRGAASIHFLSNEELANSTGASRFFIVGNSVSVPTPAPPAPTTSPVTFLFLGRFAVFTKGLDLLLDAVASIAEQLRNAQTRVMLVGSDYRGGRRWLESRTSELGIGDLVQLLNPVPPERVGEALLKASVFLHPSRHEGQPLAVLEAFAHGRPCLITPGTNLVGPVMDHGLGWIAEPTSEALAQSMLDIVHDPARILDISERAYAYATEHLRPEQEARKLVRAYQHVLTHSGGSLRKSPPA